MIYQKNQVLEGNVVDLTHEGFGVVKLDGYPVFVEAALPEEYIRFKLIKVGKKFGFGKLLEIISPSPDRVEVIDDRGRQTGTLALQHLAYSAQLIFKEKVIRDAFERIGHFEGVEVAPCQASQSVLGYRNKGSIPVRLVKGQLELGLYRKNSHDLIPLEQFRLLDPVIDKVANILKGLLRKFRIPAYDEVNHQGCVRHLVIRRGHYSSQVMVIFVTLTKDLPHQEELITDLCQQVPELKSIIQNVNKQKTNVIMGTESHCLWGQEEIEDQMLGLTFKISPQSFYQINTSQAENIYRKALELAELSETDQVLDAYCGIGTISLALAQKAGQVYAMEIVPEAIQMAKKNAQINGLNNVLFQAGSAEEWIRRWQTEGIHFDLAVVDPPRKGLDESFVESLIVLSPAKIVYVSCNPATQARDCRLLADAGYQLGTIYPYDMFPMTHHVETCVLLTKQA